MQLFIIRHAHAVDASEDAKRPLSKRGRKQIRRLARFLRKNDALPVPEVWHSPLARSKETAELLNEELGADAKLTQVDGLEGDDDPAAIMVKLKELRTSLAIVGHEPHLSAFLSMLVAGATAPRRFVLKKSAIVALERVDGNWAVRWHVSPEIVQ